MLSLYLVIATKLRVHQIEIVYDNILSSFNEHVGIAKN